MKTRRFRISYSRSSGKTSPQILCSQRELRRRAVHESGHAVAVLNLPDCWLEAVWVWPYEGYDENGIGGRCEYEYRSELNRVIVAVAGKMAIRETYGRATVEDRLGAVGDSVSAFSAVCEILDYPEWDELGRDDPRIANTWRLYRSAEGVARSLIRAYRKQLDDLVEALCQPPHRLDWEQAHRLIGGNRQPQSGCGESGGPGL